MRMVVLPDHLHAVWTMPEDDADFATRWRQIKSAFSRQLTAANRFRQPRAKGERGIWQRRYWEHTIRDQNDFTVHTDYIHINPVKHGLVPRVRDGRIRRSTGMVKDWNLSRGLGLANISNDCGDFGERP